MASKRRRDDEPTLPPRPPRPTPYDTPDLVSPAFRRLGGYAWRLAAIGVVVWGLLLLLSPLQTLILALFFALLIAAWLMPLTNWLARSMPRWLAAVLSLLVFFVAVGVVITFIGLQTASQWEGIAQAFNQGVIDIQTWLREGPLQVTDTQLVSLYQGVENFIRQSGGDIALGVLSGVGSILGVGTALAAAVFILIFILIQPHAMFGWVIGWLPERNREVVAQSIRIAWGGFSQYSQGLVLVAVTNATLVTIVLLIMGVPLAIPLGIIVFFGAFIPYIGAPIAMLLAAFVALVTDGPLAGALVIVLIFVIGQLEGNVLQPLIMGQTVNLHPVAIVLVTAVGAAYFGLLGALIGVPLAAGIYGAMKYLNGPVRSDDGSPPEPAPPGEGTF
ncbi:MAG: AI-2E family transporter [Candidatus Nanopelagicales bacterium]